MKKKIVLTFGCLSGAVSGAMMFAAVPFIDQIGFSRGAIVGYTGIVISFLFLFVFFGVRAYRESLGGEPLTFGDAFAVGILITLISCVFYVVAWEIVYFNFMPDFVERYSAHTLERMRASGAAQAAIDTKMRELADFKTMYSSLPINAALTFIEPFPIGLLMTLISAVVLRKKSAE